MITPGMVNGACPDWIDLVKIEAGRQPPIRMGGTIYEREFPLKKSDLKNFEGLCDVLNNIDAEVKVDLVDIIKKNSVEILGGKVFYYSDELLMANPLERSYLYQLEYYTNEQTQ